MAIFTSVIFSELRNKLANTVMYKRDQDGIMRGKPRTIKNPRTPDQLTQRAKMALLVDLSRRFGPILRESFRERPKGMTVFNAFVKNNMPMVQVDENYVATLELKDVVCSSGIIDAPEVTATSDESSITLTQTKQDATGTGALDDVIYAGFYESNIKSARLVKIGKRSETATVKFDLPNKWAKENINIYAFAVSKSKRHTSSTLYVALS